MGVSDTALYVFQHRSYRIRGTVCFGQRIRVFFLNDIAYLCRIGFSGCEHFSQPLEESFRLFTDDIRIGVCNHLFAHMGKTEQRILFGNQFVDVLFVNLVSASVLNGFQQVAHIPLFVHEEHSYRIQPGQLRAVSQQGTQGVKGGVSLFHGTFVLVVLP